MPWWSPNELIRGFGDLCRTEVVTFAAGRSWGVEAEFGELDGVDIGGQHRSADFTHSPEQTRLTLDSTTREQRLRATPIATEVVPDVSFYLPERYHQRPYEREGGSAPGRYALSDLKSWLAVANPGPEDPSARNGVTHEPGHSRW